MRMFNAWVLIAGVLAGVAAAMVVVFTHEVRIPPAMAAGLVAPPAGVEYKIPRQPSNIAEMEELLAGEQATHFVWWTHLGEMRLAAGDRPGAMRAWQRGADLAIEASSDPGLDPNEWQPAYRAGWNLWRLGRQDEANDWMKQTLETIEFRAMWAQTRDRRQGEEAAEEPAENEPTNTLVFGGISLWELRYIGHARAVLGDVHGTNAAFTEMIERRAADATRGSNGGRYYYDLARNMAMLGERETALSAFEAAARHDGFRRRDAWWTPSFESIREDSRFKAVLEGDVPPGRLWPQIGPPLTGDREGRTRTRSG